MANIPHIIEIAIFLLIAFLIGCGIGWFFRTVLFRSRAVAVGANLPPVAANPPADRPNLVASEKPIKSEPATSIKKSSEPAASAIVPTSSPPENTERPAEKKPLLLDKAREGGKDNLKKINGVGPKLESKLNDLGIFHFDQIAAWDSQSITWVEEHLSFKGRIERDGWVKQARSLT